ncbi:hypothetical protein VNO77_16023 [Canavalia gladiata]|uniref:Uncharacterized protein n=1 Tax=Canavalia gladiata TaxID=3824 RepID=A0AAN9M0E4_CANGL
MRGARKQYSVSSSANVLHAARGAALFPSSATSSGSRQMKTSVPQTSTMIALDRIAGSYAGCSSKVFSSLCTRPREATIPHETSTLRQTIQLLPLLGTLLRVTYALHLQIERLATSFIQYWTRLQVHLFLLQILDLMLDQIIHASSRHFSLNDLELSVLLSSVQPVVIVSRQHLFPGENSKFINSPSSTRVAAPVGFGTRRRAIFIFKSSYSKGNGPPKLIFSLLSALPLSRVCVALPCDPLLPKRFPSSPMLSKYKFMKHIDSSAETGTHPLTKLSKASYVTHKSN